MPRVYLGLGSNVDRDKHIAQGLVALEKIFTKLIVSPVYECPAVGFSGNAFYNLVVGVDTELSVAEIVKELHRIEDENDRVRGSEKFAARTLDIDLLTYGDTLGVVDAVELPRDEVLKYAFVLKPLSDIAPTDCHPQTGKNYLEHWREFSGDKDGLTKVKLCL